MDVTYKLGELFCGPGGIALGAFSAQAVTSSEKHSISHAWATDFDRDTCRTYRHNICHESQRSVICKDIRDLNVKSLLSISDIDAFAFGFPCNDFSVVGEQKGIDGFFGPLYQYGISVLDYFKPRWFVAENVGGLRNSNDGNTFQKILAALCGVGYSWAITDTSTTKY